MAETNTAVSDAELERLASCLALLASDSGEADNAGRAVGVMARRIGLSGGDLKRIFLAGAALPSGNTERDRLEAEASALRHSLARLDAEARRTGGERDALRVENRRLQSSLNSLRASARVFGVVGAVLLLAAGTAAWIGPSRPSAQPQPEPLAAGLRRAAVVRPGGAVLFPAPERAGRPLLVLAAGQRLWVRRLVWKSLFQWAEVEGPGGLTAYVLTTEIDLS